MPVPVVADGMPAVSSRRPGPASRAVAGSLLEIADPWPCASSCRPPASAPPSLPKEVIEPGSRTLGLPRRQHGQHLVPDQGGEPFVVAVLERPLPAGLAAAPRRFRIGQQLDH